RNYAELAAVLEELGIERVDGALIDAGLSSMQLDTAERGFSFQRRGPLDMRMNPEQGETAHDWLHTTPEDEMVRVLREYGDLKPARRIARAIMARRERGALETTDHLAAAVKEALPHVTAQPEETRTVFQAVRMAVNEELRWLEAGVAAALECLAPGGRFVAITFHSGEDRVVKQHLQRASRPRRELHPDGRVKAVHPPTIRILTPSPVRPTEEEIAANPRAASARLRAAERLTEAAEESRA
ncbi:MAG: 16S rRNA (cytosine(1402)-N(4))-methyltransferase RsmH, partial [Candidatus Hydrogenedentales bacterium]